MANSSFVHDTAMMCMVLFQCAYVGTVFIDSECTVLRVNKHDLNHKRREPFICETFWAYHIAAV